MSELSNDKLFSQVGEKAQKLLGRKDITKKERAFLKDGVDRVGRSASSLADDTIITGAQRIEAISAKYGEKDRIKLQRIAGKTAKPKAR